MKIDFAQLDKKFGAVEHEGKHYTLATVATLSNRLFPGWWGEAEEGDSYVTEYVADAYDDNGDRYQVYWQFDAIKGQEPEDEGSWPWSDENITRVWAQ